MSPPLVQARCRTQTARNPCNYVRRPRNLRSVGAIRVRDPPLELRRTIWQGSVPEEKGPIAQLVEQRAFNPLVAGSIPAGLTNQTTPTPSSSRPRTLAFHVSDAG